MSREDDKDLTSLMEAIRSHYGYDFSGYSRASLERRIRHAAEKTGRGTLGQVLDRLMKDPAAFREFLSDLTVNVTEMFRDPQVFLAIRQHVVPVLRTYPSLRIWVAGCATGEEAYTLAILLQEEGLYDKTLIYATDISPRAIEQAKEGIYSTEQIRIYTANYQKAGGVEPFSKYYTAGYGKVKLNSSLRRNIVFSLHNLVTDDIFSEVQMVVCRNVLIYFDRQLQHRALDLFYRSLARRGYMVLGIRESVDHTDVRDLFEVSMRSEKIFRRI